VSDEYWLIEKIIDGAAHWWIPGHLESAHWNDPVRWTTDSSKARHYDSKADAEYVMGGEMVSVGCIATGHIDCSGPDLSA